MTDASILAYVREFTEVSDDQVAGWRVLVPEGERLPTLIGNCPTCTHRCEVPIADEVVQGGTPAIAEGARTPVFTRVITCNCLSDHQPPTGVRAGCGRFWLATVTLAEDGSYRVAVERNLQLLPAAAALNEAVAGQDKRIQAAAEKWLGAVTAIYGLFSLTGLATAKDALAGLSTASKWIVVVVFVAGLAAAGLALFNGYSAAYQWPRTVEVDDNEKLLAWYRSYRGYAHTAAAHLQKAIVFAFGSLAAVTAVAMLMWFLPRH